MMRPEIHAPDRAVCALTGDISPDARAEMAANKAVMDWIDEKGMGRALVRCTPSMVAGIAITAYRKSLGSETDTDVVAQLRTERDDARAELANMVDLTIEVGCLGEYLRHALNDRDDYREQADEYRDMYHDAQVRMDELAAENADLRGKLVTVQGERDTAKYTDGGL